MLLVTTYFSHTSSPAGTTLLRSSGRVQDICTLVYTQPPKLQEHILFSSMQNSGMYVCTNVHTWNNIEFIVFVLCYSVSFVCGPLHSTLLLHVPLLTSPRVCIFVCMSPSQSSFCYNYMKIESLSFIMDAFGVITHCMQVHGLLLSLHITSMHCARHMIDGPGIPHVGTQTGTRHWKVTTFSGVGCGHVIKEGVQKYNGKPVYMYNINATCSLYIHRHVSPLSVIKEDISLWCAVHIGGSWWTGFWDPEGREESGSLRHTVVTCSHAEVG